MNIIQKIAKNTSALFVSQFIVSILSIILSISVARNLGDVLFGKYSFALAFVAFYAVFSNLGYNTLLIRDVARDTSQASKYLSNILSIRALLSLVIFSLIVLTINVMGYPADTKNVVYIFGIYTLLISLSDVFKVTFRAFQKMEYEASITIIFNMVRVSLGLLVLFLGYGLMVLALVFLFSGVFDFLFSFLACERKFVKSRTELDLYFLKSTIKIAVPIGMLSIFALIYARIDMIMLSVMKGDVVVGWYAAASNLTYGFKPIPHLFMSALFPLMSYYYASSKNLLKKSYEKSFKYLLILGLPLAVGISLLADKIILFFYGQQFSNSIIALQILSWDILLIFLYACSAFLLISMDKQNQMAIVAGCTALINVILNLFLIPSYSYVGAAMATISAEGFLLISYIYLNSRHLHTIPIHKMIIKPSIACGAMGLFIYQVNGINLFLQIIIAIILYFVILYLLKGFSDEDVSLFRKLINR